MKTHGISTPDAFLWLALSLTDFFYAYLRYGFPFYFSWRGLKHSEWQAQVSASSTLKKLDFVHRATSPMVETRDGKADHCRLVINLGTCCLKMNASFINQKKILSNGIGRCFRVTSFYRRRNGAMRTIVTHFFPFVWFVFVLFAVRNSNMYNGMTE
jgi:hypothetical protein